MIGSIRGTLLDRDTRGTVLVEANGVGYEVSVTGPTSVHLGELGSPVFLHIFTRVREDAITLYGFASAEEKRCFDALLGAHGVGPSMALALLSIHSPADLRQIVALEDSEALSRVPGIGKKTASRLLLELQQKFEVELDEELVDIRTKATASPEQGARNDVIAALAGLGYGGDEIRSVLNGLPADGDAADLLRLALKELSKV